MRRPGGSAAILTFALAAATGAVVLALRASFLRWPGWVAVQRADLILAPVTVGLIWRRRRPASRFGPWLVVFGLLAIPLAFEASSNPRLFAVGVLWESVYLVATVATLLAFPSGRLTARAERAVVAAAAVLAVLVSIPATVLAPHVAPGLAVTHCRERCPGNGLAIIGHPWAAERLQDVAGWGAAAVVGATGVILLLRLLHASAPRRRALVTGASVGIFWAACLVAFVIVTHGELGSDQTITSLVWFLFVARAAIVWGFLLALVRAELFAARVLRRVASDLVRPAAIGDTEAVLRCALGDPRLRLGFWHAAGGEYVDAAGSPLVPPEPGTGRVLTEVRRGSARAALDHDAQLSDDPELLEATATAALLAHDTSQLEATLNATIRELRSSRARLLRAGDTERRRLERELHDGAQRELGVVRAKLGAASDLARNSPELHGRLTELGGELELALVELEALSHGLYPAALADEGLVVALQVAAGRLPRPAQVHACDVGRYPIEVETAVYLCCLEALQNAMKHAGPDAAVRLELAVEDGLLRFEVSDDGAGFCPDAGPAGVGLHTMHDRVAALGGTLQVQSEPGRGTRVRGAVTVSVRATAAAGAARRDTAATPRRGG